jgi:hypothetical protein
MRADRVAALYVETGGVYFGLADVDPWDKKRDARLYAGPWPVVAHPPCERWGRYWSGGPTAKVRKTRGDDGGCFASALTAVRIWGGVLEHPEASSAWAAFDLTPPVFAGCWWSADFQGGYTCCVEQGHYGHRARKKTWLYACRVDLPSLRWGPSVASGHIDDGMHSAEERRMFMRPPANMPPEWRERRHRWLERRARLTGKELLCPERLGRRERCATPIPFRDLLLSIARSAVAERRGAAA